MNAKQFREKWITGVCTTNGTFVNPDWDKDFNEMLQHEKDIAVIENAIKLGKHNKEEHEQNISNRS